jgi:hypothetical protein
MENKISMFFGSSVLGKVGLASEMEKLIINRKDIIVDAGLMNIKLI